VLVVCDELDESTLVRCHRSATRTGLGDDLEVDADGRARGDYAKLPRACLANADLHLADGPTLLVRGDGMANHSRDPELLRRLDIEGDVESHGEVTIGVLCEEAEEGLLEDGGGKRVGDDDRAVGAVREGLHFEEANLVEAASEEVYGMAACRGASSQGREVLQVWNGETSGGNCTNEPYEPVCSALLSPCRYHGVSGWAREVRCSLPCQGPPCMAHQRRA